MRKIRQGTRMAKECVQLGDQIWPESMGRFRTINCNPELVAPLS